MSRAVLETRLVSKLLEQVEKNEHRLASKISREILESSKVNQCLVTTNKALKVLHAGMEAATDRNIDFIQYTTYLRKQLELRKKPWPIEDPGMAYFTKLIKRHGLDHKNGTIMYMGGGFKNLKETIKTINKKYITEKLKLEPEQVYDGPTFGNTVNLDHGISGASTASLGGISTAMQIATEMAGEKGIDQEKFEKLAQSNYDQILNETLSSTVSKGLELMKTSGHRLLTTWENVVGSEGRLKAGLSIIIKPVLKEDNLDLGAIEKIEYQYLLESIARALVDIDYLNLEGSSSPKNKIAKRILVDNMANALRGKKKVTIDPKVKSAGNKSKTSISKDVKGVKLKGGARKVQSMGQARDSKGRFISTKKPAIPKAVSAIRLQSLINAKLPKYVADNMGSPRLNYISGRFANSTRITHLSQTKQGVTNVEYTYRLYPYQTFEPGFAQGSRHRDPRSLIALSIREIAAELQITRLNIRRV